MPKRSKSSRRWLNEHFSDEYVLRAQQEGWRSRAVFKLEEIDRRDRLLRPGLTVVDLGAAPGGWSQYAAKRMAGQGRILALDILAMPPLSGVEFLQGDFMDQAVLAQLLAALEPGGANLVMSDMAPNMSGELAVDIPRAMYLAELTLELARQVLKPGGDLLLKVFQGEGFPALNTALRTDFARLAVRKPRASRGRSREVYLLGRGFRGDSGHGG